LNVIEKMRRGGVREKVSMQKLLTFFRPETPFQMVTGNMPREDPFDSSSPPFSWSPEIMTAVLKAPAQRTTIPPLTLGSSMSLDRK